MDCDFQIDFIEFCLFLVDFPFFSLFLDLIHYCGVLWPLPWAWEEFEHEEKEDVGGNDREKLEVTEPIRCHMVDWSFELVPDEDEDREEQNDTEHSVAEEGE